LVFCPAYYSIRITRIRDGKVLIDFQDDHIDMWRIGSSYIRSKFGLYGSLAGGRLDRVPRPESAAEDRVDLGDGPRLPGSGTSSIVLAY
jgi:hypothetical protein